ncbi:MAG: dihydrodipicolinate synthase family protein [Anaerolineae bacterium]
MSYNRSEAKAYAREKIRGVWAAIPTPFTPEGDLDEWGLRRNVRHCIEGLEVDGLFCGGVMGEFWALTGAERRRVQELVAEEAAGRVPLIAQTGHPSMREAAALSRHAHEAGFDFVIIMNPYYPPRLTEEMIYAYYAAIADQVDLGISLFNTRYSGYQLRPQFIARLAEIDNICAIKNPQPIEHTAKVQRLAGDKIVVTEAAESHWLTLMTEHGLQALMASATPFLYQTPEDKPLKTYTELAFAGQMEEAQSIATALEARRRVYHRWMVEPWIERGVVPIAYLKHWTELMGMAAGPVRPPLLPLTEEEKTALRTDLERVGLLAGIANI